MIHWLREVFDSFISDCVTQNVIMFFGGWVGYDVGLLRVPGSSVNLVAVTHGEVCPDVLSSSFEARTGHLLFVPTNAYI